MCHFDNAPYYHESFLRLRIASWQWQWKFLFLSGKVTYQRECGDVNGEGGLGIEFPHKFKITIIVNARKRIYKDLVKEFRVQLLFYPFEIISKPADNISP